MTAGPREVAIIAAVAKNGVIGRDNGLPWRLKSDLAHFKALTMGATLVMGRRTFQSIGRPLPGRRTIVVTRGTVPGVDCAASITDALHRAEGRVFLAGGTQIYRGGLAHAHTLYLTRVDAAPEGDATFPSFDGFERISVEAGTRGPDDDHDFTFETWTRTHRS